MAALIEGYHASGNPRVCITCHSMDGAGATWQMSNHKQFACVECHMPASGTVPRVVYKMRAGLHDLYHELIRDYPASLSISATGRRVVNGNCLRCHRSTVERPVAFAGERITCTGCHRHTVHHVTRTTED
jgi:cytochrome c nitrite reductase small subunit